jgi:hypothetical protein
MDKKEKGPLSLFLKRVFHVKPTVKWVIGSSVGEASSSLGKDPTVEAGCKSSVWVTKL